MYLCTYYPMAMPRTQGVGYGLEDFGVMWVWRFRIPWRRRRTTSLPVVPEVFTVLYNITNVLYKSLSKLRQTFANFSH